MYNSALLSDAQHPDRQTGDTYLRLQLDEQTQAVLPTQQTQEVVVVPRSRIAPIPAMPEAVLGLLNHRSRVFWLIDLPFLLGLSPLETDASEFEVAIVRPNNLPLGLGIRHIRGIVRFPESAIQSPIGTVSSEVAPYLRGCILLPETGIVLVLDPLAIANGQF